MVDNRSAGFFGIGGSFNFKRRRYLRHSSQNPRRPKWDRAANTSPSKNSLKMTKIRTAKNTQTEAQFLRATLNSLAMMNVANVINARKKALEEQKEREKNKNNLKDESKQEQAEKDLEEEFYQPRKRNKRR